MASLYIKDGETAALAAEVALLTGTTKTDAVRDALRRRKAEIEADQAERAKQQSTVEWLLEYRKKHPLPPPTGLKADKAFFDELWGEDPD